ncbi:MAG: xanthan lyase [Bacteroidales bacterium]|nr:xanthan lyase [Bacteroidales bacterium]
MKRIILSLALVLAALPSLAQTPRARDFNTVVDSLQVRLQRRTGVRSRLKLEKVLARGNVLDFYFSINLLYQPYRKGDITWLTEQIQELGVTQLGNYKVGTLYAKGQKLSAMPQPALGYDGSALSTSFRVKEPPKTTPLVQGADNWPQGLSGRHIALWQSHGRYFDDELGLWDWQRSPNHRTLEDVYTQSYVLPFLIPMLENAGAVVLTPRERDIQTREVVCDNDPAFTEGRGPAVRTRGRYQEEGDWQDAGTGFADFSATYKGYDFPFSKGSARKIHTAREDEEPARAIWRPTIEEKGSYAVYVSYKTLPESTSDARYTIHHLGGETLKHVNQQMGGGMWIYLGTYLFDKGNHGYVELTNLSSQLGVVTADAVRFGGGMGKVERGGSLSGMPAYIEGSLYNFQYSGIDLAITDEWDREYTKEYAGRGAWVQEISGGSRVNPDKEGRHIPIDLSLAFHTDAGVTPNDSIVGTLAIYTLKCNGSELLPDGEKRLNARLLADLVQTQVVEDIRAAYEPDWTRREIWDRSYSESRTTGVPGLLLELLSHQNFADMRYGLDPGFRFTACRGVYKGILKFLSARYGVPYVVQPLPVHGFRAQLDSTRQAVLSWAETLDSREPTAKADYYKVYTRVDDGGFDAGRQVSQPECRLPLEPGHVYSFKITACNAGGESFPSEVLAAGFPSADARKVVVVNNFTRVSAPAWFDTPQYAGFTDNLESGVPWGTDILYAGTVFNFDRNSEYTSNDNPGFGGSFTDMCGSQIAGNTFDFVAAHGRAVLEAGYAFESASAESFDGTSDAFALDLICGKQLTTRVGRGAVPDKFQVFPEALQNAIRSFTGKGGHVLLSGAYIATDAWDALYPGVPKAPEATRTFVKQVLGYQWVTNFGDVSGFALPQAKSGLPTVSYNRAWSPLVYKVDNADGLAPAGKDTRILLRYKGTDIPAATLYNGKGYQVAAFGFPLETSAQMDEVIGSVLHSFGQLDSK